MKKIGDHQSFTINTRVIAATNKDLLILVKKGIFREDLFYRLNVITVDLPPLRKREGDIALLAGHFLRKYSDDEKQLTFSSEVIGFLNHYAWPGNIRELENTIQRIVIMVDQGEIKMKDLPDYMKHSIPVKEDLSKSLAEMEQDYITKVLNDQGGNKTKAARILGITRKTLRKKAKYKV